MGAAVASPAYSNSGEGKESSDLDNVLARLEEQEANTEKEGAAKAEVAKNANLFSPIKSVFAWIFASGLRVNKYRAGESSCAVEG